MNKKEEPQVVEIPDSRTFANQLVESFMHEQGITIDNQENADPLDVILSIPDLHLDFTLWLCDLVRDGSFEETASPPNTMLN